MKNKNGISMISLIVTIACIIILSSLSIGTGMKYLRESKSRDKENFVKLLSSAVSRREEETNLDSTEYPYLGYHISDVTVFESFFAPKVAESLNFEESINFEDGTWYIIDETAAKSLGIKSSENYVSNVGDSEDDVTVALVNYMTGDVYMIDMSASDVKELDLSEETVVTGHTHVKNIEEPTCTEAVRCIECGYIFKEALGHTYSGEAGSTIPKDSTSHYNKACTRCGKAGGYEAHTFAYKQLDVGGIWYHKEYCTVCNWNAEDSASDGREKCTVQYSLPESDTDKKVKHILNCKVCGKKETQNHTIAYRYITESMHETYCSDDKCGYVIAQELHVDSNSDSVCDNCKHAIVDYGYPQLASVVCYKKGASDSEKYYAKYGDTVVLEFTADRKIQNLSVKIAGYSVPASGMTSSDEKTWKVEFTLADTLSISDGKLAFKIDCESTSGIEMSQVTTTTDKKYVTFDGSSPSVEYIEKKNLAE